MGTYKNLEKIEIHGDTQEFWKIQDTYTNFEKIQQKQSFHHRLTILWCGFEQIRFEHYIYKS